MSLHYHYEMIVDKAIKGAVSDIVQLEFTKRIQIADAFKGVRNEVLAIILPDVYGKVVNNSDSANSSDAVATSVSEPAAVDMVCESGSGVAPVVAPRKPARKPANKAVK